MSPTKPERHINKLKAGDQYKLMKLVEAEFTERRQTDDEFAAYATEQIGALVKGSNVFGAREALGIESSRIKMTNSTIESRLVLVEKRLKELEDRYNDHIKHSAGVAHFGGGS